jgi:hypothetical protein
MASYCLSLLCCACRPLDGAWIWHEEAFTEPLLARWTDQQQFVGHISPVLRTMAELARTQEETIQVAECMIYYTRSGYPWTSESSTLIATEFLTTTENKAMIARSVMDTVVKPAFANPSHPGVSTAGRKKQIKAQQKVMSNLGEDTSPPWREKYQGSIGVLEWSLTALRADTDLKDYWPLIVPSVLNVIDDHDASIKTKGCSLAGILLDNVDPQFLAGTGLVPVFWEAIKTCLYYLPPSTSVPQSTRIIGGAVDALLQISSKDKTSLQKLHHLNEIVRDGIFRGIDQAGQKIELTSMLLQKLQRIIGELKIDTVRHLRKIVKIFLHILSDPFVSAFQPLVVLTCDVMKTTMSWCWPRMDQYKYEILKGLVRAWKTLQKDGEITEDARTALRTTVISLQDILSEKTLAEELTRLTEHDKTLCELFATTN